MMVCAFSSELWWEVVNVVKREKVTIFLCAVGQVQHLKGLPVLLLDTVTVVTVWMKEGKVYLRSLFGQSKNMNTC